MAPWDEARYFRLPVETPYSLPAAVPALQVAKADPQRVYLAMACANTVTCTVSTAANMPINGAMQLQQTTLPLQLYWEDAAVLVQAPWYALGNAAGSILIVWEVFLDRWPDEPAEPADEPLRVTLQRLVRSIDRLILRR